MPTRYPMIGDLHKPFHLPECESAAFAALGRAVVRGREVFE